MIGDHAEVPPAISPEELDMLQRVFDRICQQRGLTKQSREAASVAASLMALFQSGIRSEKQLLAMMSGGGSYP
jgi:hypothetical protein